MELFVPAEITTDILSRLPVHTLMQCKSVSKSWRALIDDPTFVDNYTLEHEEEGFLFYMINNKGKQIFYYGEYNYKDTSFKICELINHHDMTKMQTVVGSCKGLICFSSSDRSNISVCNLFTGEYMILPKLIDIWDIHQGTAASGFGYHPITKQYKVVAICFNRFESSEHVVYVHTLGSNRWRCKGKIGRSLCSIKAWGTHVNGALYWMNMTEIITFDLATEELRTLPSPPQLKTELQPGNCYYDIDLGVLGGSLCMVEPNFICHCSYVYVMNSKDYSWTKTSSIQWKGRYCKHKPAALSIHGKIWLDCMRHEGTVEIYDVKTKMLRIIKILKEDRWPEYTKFIPFTKSFVSLKALFADEDGREKENNHIMVSAAIMLDFFHCIPLEKPHSFDHLKFPRDFKCLLPFGARF